MSSINKIRIVVISIIVIFLIIFVSLLYRIKNSVVMNGIGNNLNQKIDNQKVLNMEDDYVDIIRTIAEKDADWSYLPLSKSFRNKYNNKYGILGKNDNYTSIDTYVKEYQPNFGEKIVIIIVFHDSKKEEYYIHYTLNDQNELDDVEIVEKKLLYDENGNQIIYKVSMEEENYQENIARLAYPRGDFDYRKAINFTKNYEENFINGFINSRGFDVFTCMPINELCNYQDKIVYLKCEYPKYDDNDADNIVGIDDDLTLYYKVKYTTDDKLWLDDVDVEEVSKDEIDKLLTEVENG